MNPSAVDAGCWNCQKTVEVASKERGVGVDGGKMKKFVVGGKVWAFYRRGN